MSKEFEDYDRMLQEKYPILKRPDNREYPNPNYTIYQNYGFEGISLAWLKTLINPMMEEICKCYADRNMEPTLIVEQCKEKWGFLKFYYSLGKNHRSGLQGIDAIGGNGIRLYPKDGDDESIASDIATIVSKYEIKSREVCISCGKYGETRNLRWKQVLCDKCYDSYLKKMKEGEEKRRNTVMKKSDVLDPSGIDE